MPEMKANVSLLYYKFENGSPAQSLESWCDLEVLIHSKFKRQKNRKDAHLFILQTSPGKLITAFKNYTTHSPRISDAAAGLLSQAFVKLQSGF